MAKYITLQQNPKDPSRVTPRIKKWQNPKSQKRVGTNKN